MVKKFYGKKIDLLKLKQPVVTNIREHLRKRKELVNYLAKNEKQIDNNSCYLCGCQSYKELVKIQGFTYVQCDSCTHVFTTMRYADDSLKRFYQKNQYYSEITYANEETCFYRREHVAKPKIEFTEQFTSGFRGSWLDVGSGVGDIVSVAKEKGWRATGLEISEGSVKFAKQIFDIELVQQPFEEFCQKNPKLTTSFDVVSFIGLLEHVVNPMDYLSRAWKMLRLNGLVVIQVPNANSLSTMVQTLFPEHVFRHMSPVEHIMIFTEQSLFLALEKTGFKPIALWFFGMDVYELFNHFLLLDERVQGSELFTELYKNLNELQFVFDRQKLSDLLFCIAQKI